MKVRRKRIYFLIGFFLLSVLVYFLPIPVTQTARVTIRMPYLKTFEQISSLENWKRWWPDSTAVMVKGDTIFANGRTAYILNEKKMLSLVFKEDYRLVYHVLTVVPATYDSVSTVQWKKLSYLRTAVDDQLGGWFGRHKYSPDDLLQSLKKTLEDPVRYYGFPISVGPVEDTFVLVKSTFTTRSRLQESILNTYRFLHSYLDSVHYTGRAERMLYMDSSRADSVEVIAGFSITKLLNVQLPLRVMTMPKAHIVIGEYEGDYRNIGAIHRAIQNFMLDHRISAVAIEYEKMLSNPRTAQDSQHVRVKVYHPSYIP